MRGTEEFTKEHLDYAKEHYIKDTGLPELQIKPFLDAITPETEEKFMGRATVKQVFKIGGVGAIAGMQVTEGMIQRSNIIRLVRDGTIVTEGKISSLKRFKDDAREIKSGMEGGLGIDGYNDIKEGDILEAFIIEETKES